MRELAPAALLGVVVGIGLGLGTNVSGVVLALYGGIAAVVFAAAALWFDARGGPRRRRRG